MFAYFTLFRLQTHFVCLFNVWMYDDTSWFIILYDTSMCFIGFANVFSLSVFATSATSWLAISIHPVNHQGIGNHWSHPRDGTPSGRSFPGRNCEASFFFSWNMWVTHESPEKTQRHGKKKTLKLMRWTNLTSINIIWLVGQGKNPVLKKMTSSMTGWWDSQY